MFLPCPQCGFLVALIAPRGNAAQRCPRCGYPLPRPDELGETPAVVPASQRPAGPAAPDVDPAVSTLPAASTGHAPADEVAAFRSTPDDGVTAYAESDDMAGEAAHADPGNAATPRGDLARPPAAPMASEDSARFDATAPERLRPPVHVDAGASPSPASTEPTPTLAFPLHDDTAAAAMADAAAHLREPAPATRRSPSFARRARARARHAGRRWPLYLGIVLLALALALQLLLAQRRELAADPQWRPWVESTCRLLRCEVPAWHQPAAFTMLDRSVRPRANAPGVLVVHARFRNDAPWPQAWPVVVLSLSDVEGRVLGTRAFAPRDYAPATRPATLAPGQSGTLTLDVVEPAPGVVAFGFDFR